MESPTSACSMPDVKATTCDHLLTGPPVGCGIDLERCLTELPASQFSMGSPLSDIPACDAVAYSGLRDSCPVMTTCPSKALLTDLGLRYCSTSSMYPLKQSGVQPPPAEGSPRRVCVNVASSRLYHSMENLHWAAVPNPGLYAFGAPYRSVDSEFIFRCTTTSHWYNGASEAFYPCQMPARQELPLFPQWLFPGVDERTLNLNTRRGVKEKLRLQSARVAEPHRPLRAQPTPGAWVPSQELCDRGSALLSGADVAPPPQHFSSLAEIKQEVMKRLQLRRQRSTPNLSLPSEQPGAVVKSQTAESLVPQGGASEPTKERRRPPVGRLHIPTFEEFKRMRQKERVQAGVAQNQASSGMGLTKVEASADHDGQVTPQGVGTGIAGRASPESRQRGGAVGLSLYNRDCGSGGGDPDTSLGTAGGQSENTDSVTVAICTSPTPRFSIKLLSGPPQGKVGNSAQTADTDGSLGNSAPRWESLETSSSCCPALLLDGTELSSYGAKISKIKDGFIGSAFDLIKKSCSAEVAAEAPVRVSRDRDSADITGSQPGCQSSVVSMTMPACSTEAHSKPVGGGEPTECQHSSPGCRRSSSDAAYEPAESVRVQRECRLRPHFSDPMPADATKRKQLEMKLAAAAARLHGRDRKPEKARGHSEPHMGARSIGLGVTLGAQHRWSNLSSLSADSGVVGLNDERDEDEEPPSACPATDVDRVGKWKRPSASLRAWEAQRPCPDCGHRDSARGNSMCDRCLKLRRERKEAILEFLSTESSFREDLRIIKEEFYSPMQSAGLLTAEQLAVVFGNVQELIDVNDKFTEYLQDSIDQAFDRGDEDLLTVCIGELFLEFVNMLPAFQTYCLQQSTSVNMLNTLEKEKELLRIFLDVSQNDNIALRRMNLRSFLMAPLQRVTKYPLLLSRISKATAECHPDYARLWEAKSRVESHLEHINMKTKQEGTSWSLRSFRRDSRKNREVINIEMREVSMKTVGWARESTRFVMEGPLQLSQPADGQWVKKGSKALKFQNVQSLLMVHMQEGAEESGLTGQELPEPVRDGVLVLIKDKSSGKFAVLREPIRLSNCVVSSDPDCDDTFELLDIPREAFVFRAADKCCTQQWFRQIKRYSHDLGPWRKRRNALPNIMINTAQNRS